MMPRTIAALAFAASLAACAPESVRYAGVMKPEQGLCAPGVGQGGAAAATLLLQGDKAQFAPTDGVTVLSGQVSSSGHVVAGSNAMGADHKPFPQVFEGDRTGDKVVGRFGSPRCRAAVELTRR